MVHEWVGLKIREEKFKTSLRVGFFFDFRNFILQVPQRKWKNIHKWLIYQSKAISFYSGTGKNRNQIYDISVENRQTKFNLLRVCVLTHTRFEILEFSLSVFYRNITILISKFFSCQNKNLWLLIDILITNKFF